MAEINDLNVSDASNTARFPENMAPSAVNDGDRAQEGILARWHKDTNGSTATTGSANAYVFAANQTFTAYYDGMDLTFAANFTNTGAATLNVDSLGAKSILKSNDIALESGDIESGQKVRVVYDGTSFQMMSPAATALTGTTGGASGLENIVEDLSPQLGGRLDTNSFQVGWSKGADVASSSTLNVGSDGNYFDVTGTTGITSIATEGVGTVIKLHFDGILTMTHHATDLVLIGAADITTTAGAEAEFVEYATGDWRMTSYADAGTNTGQATQAAIEAETNENTYIPPDLLKHHPGIPKAWCRFNGTGTLSLGPSYGVSSVTDNGTGDYTVNFSTDFSSTAYTMIGNYAKSIGTGDIFRANAIFPISFAVGACRFICSREELSGEDGQWVSVAFYGDQ